MNDGDHLILGGDSWLCVLTGAGVSAESGIATFRNAGGLREGHRDEEVASPEGFEADPELVWHFHGARRRQAAMCAPNRGHLALADVERRMAGRFVLATQNVDGLHALAGYQRVVELHGSHWRTRCSSCDSPPFDDRSDHEGTLPRCEVCRSRGREGLLRPDIVGFGEALEPTDLVRLAAFLDQGAKHRLVFLAVRTSGVVFPAAGLVDDARAARRRGSSTPRRPRTRGVSGGSCAAGAARSCRGCSCTSDASRADEARDAEGVARA